MTKVKAPPASKSAAELIVLGFNDRFEPCAARFAGAKPDTVIKAAHRIGFKAYPVTSRDLAVLARKVPEGRLNSKGAMTVPKVPQSLYSEIVVELVADPKQAIETADQASELPTATGLPSSWDQVAPGHLVIAEEGPGYGWWEAIVIERNGDMCTLRYRQFPKLPAFARRRNAIALKSPPEQ
jgi:hypothetical protein